MKLKLCLTALALVCAAGVPANAQEMKAEVIHWWTSGGESAAVKVGILAVMVSPSGFASHVGADPGSLSC